MLDSESRYARPLVCAACGLEFIAPWTEPPITTHCCPGLEAGVEDGAVQERWGRCVEIVGPALVPPGY